MGIQTLELEQISHLSVIEIEEMGKKRLSYYDLVVEPPKTCKEQVEKKEEVKVIEGEGKKILEQDKKKNSKHFKFFKFVSNVYTSRTRKIELIFCLQLGGLT